MNRYTDVIAAEKLSRGGAFRAWHLLRIPGELFVRLVLRLGILDGRAGVIHAAMAAFYAFVQYAKLWRELLQPTADSNIWKLAAEALGREVLALEHLGDGGLRGEREHVTHRQRGEPVGVVHDLQALGQ